MNLRTSFLIVVSFLAGSCSITATRPVQDMSYAVAAIRAAKEVQADVIVPDLFQQSRTWYFRAKKDYRLKNFAEAKKAADKAREFAEEAEFVALQKGGSRDITPEDPLADPAGATPVDPSEYEDKSQYVERAEQDEAYKRKLELEKARGQQLKLVPGSQNSSTPQ